MGRRYHDLCTSANETEAIELLRLSSALPIAFRQGSTPAGQAIVDGGLADNVPYLPVVSTDVEAIIIVLLSPDATLSADRIEQSLSWRWKSFCVPSLPPEAAVELYQDRFGARAIPDAKWFSGAPTLHGRHVVVIGPTSPLARFRRFPFLTGTLNLSRAARVKWFQQGYEDAMTALTARV